MTSCKHLNHKHRATGLQPECSSGTNMQSESRRVTGCTGNIRKLLFFTRSLHLRYKTQKIYRTYSEDTELQKRSPFTRQTQVSQNFRCSHLQLQQNGRSFALDLHLFGIRFLHCFFTRDPFRFVSTLNFITWPENNRRLPCRGANRNNLWQNLLILLDSAKFNKGMQLEVTRVGNQRHNFMKFSPLAMQPVSRVPIQTFRFAISLSRFSKGMDVPATASWSHLAATIRTRLSTVFVEVIAVARPKMSAVDTSLTPRRCARRQHPPRVVLWLLELGPGWKSTCLAYLDPP